MRGGCTVTLRQAAALLALVGVTLLARPALATPSAKLTYLRGPGAERCPDEDALRKAVSARLGYDLFFPWASKTVVAEITHTAGRKGFRGRVKIVDAQGLVRGERALDATSDDCAEIMRALALAISIAVDDLDLDAVPPPAPAPVPPAAEPGLEPAPPPSPAETGQPGSPPPPDRPRPPRPDVPRRLSFEGWITPLASVGVAPEASLGVVAAAGVRYGLVSLSLEARGDLPASGGDTSGKVQTFLVLGSVAPCLHAPRPLFVCGLASLGTFQEQGTDLQHPRSGAAPFRAVGGRIGVELPLSSLVFFLAHVDGLGTLTRHTVQIDNQEAFTLPAFSASVGFGAGMHF